MTTTPIISNPSSSQIFEDLRRELDSEGTSRKITESLEAFWQANPVSKESKREISLVQKRGEGTPLSETHTRNTSLVLKSRVFSEGHKRKLSLAKLGVKRPPITEKARRNRSLGQIGRIHSQETRRKISLARKGKKHSEETRRKMSATRQRKALCAKEEKMAIERNEEDLYEWRLFLEGINQKPSTD